MNAIVFCRSLSQVIGCLAVRAGDQGLPTARLRPVIGVLRAMSVTINSPVRLLLTSLR